MPSSNGWASLEHKDLECGLSFMYKTEINQFLSMNTKYWSYIMGKNVKKKKSGTGARKLGLKNFLHDLQGREIDQ